MGTGQCNVKAYNRQLRDLISTGQREAVVHRLARAAAGRGAGRLRALRRARRRLDEGRAQARRVTGWAGRVASRSATARRSAPRLAHRGRHADLRVRVPRVRAVHGDAADGGVPRSVRLPGLRLQRSTDIPQRTQPRRHGLRPPQSCRFERARREGGPSRRLRLLRTSVAPPERVVIEGGARSSRQTGRRGGTGE